MSKAGSPSTIRRRAGFTPGGNAIGIVHAVGPEVYHLKPGQRAAAAMEAAAQADGLECVVVKPS